MSETQFLHRVEETLVQIEAALDEAGIDADCSRSGHVLTIELENGAQIVVNAQAPMRQIWLASRSSGAMHFDADGDRWIDRRSGAELFESLSRVMTALTGTETRLAG